MADIPARDLRNNVSGILRRAEAGERLRVTARGRPVAEIGPLPSRPRMISWEAFIAASEEWRADPKLAQDLARLLSDTTDTQIR
jgi:prevent-host-death family protein